jgi:hypothetical protein
MTENFSPLFRPSRWVASFSMCLMAGLVAGCSAFEPEVVPCPEISAAQGAERVVTIGANLQHEVSIRFNGVAAVCTPRNDGFAIKMEVGLMLKRDEKDWNKTERVPFDITLAFVDSKNEVVSRYVYSDEAFIGDLDIKSRPTFIVRTNIPSGTRVVMGLGRAVTSEE